MTMTTLLLGECEQNAFTLRFAVALGCVTGCESSVVRGKEVWGKAESS